jgi:hypothetical protein
VDNIEIFLPACVSSWSILMPRKQEAKLLVGDIESGTWDVKMCFPLFLSSIMQQEMAKHLFSVAVFVLKTGTDETRKNV